MKRLIRTFLPFAVLALTAAACSTEQASSDAATGPRMPVSATLGQNTGGSLYITAYTLNKPAFSPGGVSSYVKYTYSWTWPSNQFLPDWSSYTTGYQELKYPSPKPDTGMGGMIQVFAVHPSGEQYVLGSVDADNSSLEQFGLPHGYAIELRAYAMPGYKFLRYDNVPGTLAERSTAIYRIPPYGSHGDIRGWFQEDPQGGSGGGGSGGGGFPYNDGTSPTGCPNGAIIC